MPRWPNYIVQYTGQSSALGIKIPYNQQNSKIASFTELTCRLLSLNVNVFRFYTFKWLTASDWKQIWNATRKIAAGFALLNARHWLLIPEIWLSAVIQKRLHVEFLPIGHWIAGNYVTEYFREKSRHKPTTFPNMLYASNNFVFSFISAYRSTTHGPRQRNKLLERWTIIKQMYITVHVLKQSYSVTAWTRHVFLRVARKWISDWHLSWTI